MVQINNECSKTWTVLHMIRDMWWKLRLLNTSAMWTGFHFTFMLCHFDRHGREIEHLTDIDFERFDFTQRSPTSRSPTSLTRVHTMDDAMMWTFHLMEHRSLMSFLSAWLVARWLARRMGVKTVRRWRQMAIGAVFFSCVLPALERDI